MWSVVVGVRVVAVVVVVVVVHRYDLGFITFRDTHNVGILVGVWISVAFVYFIDLQVGMPYYTSKCYMYMYFVLRIIFLW